MLKRFNAVLLLAAAFAFSSQAMAHSGSHQHELTGTTLGNLTLVDMDDVVFTGTGGYNYALVPNLQIGLQSTFVTDFDGTLAWQAVAGPTFNISMGADDLSNAFFVGAFGGFVMVDTPVGDSATEFAYSFQLGKRFELVSSVNWRPYVELIGTTADGDDPNLAIVPVSFSFFF